MEHGGEGVLNEIERYDDILLIPWFMFDGLTGIPFCNKRSRRPDRG